MSKILLGVDDSESSDRACDYVSEEYDPDTDKIFVLHAVDVPDILEGYNQAREEVREHAPGDVREEFKQRALKIAEEVTERLEADDFSVNTMTAIGDAGEEICVKANEEDVDCIVVGRRNRGTAKELLLGSVSHYVLHHAECPVTVVPSAD